MWSFHVVVLLRTVKKCTKNYNARAQPLFCSLVLSFSDVPAAVAVVVFVKSLVNTPVFLVLTPEFGHMPMPWCKVSTLNSALNGTWVFGVHRVWTQPGTSAWGPSVNTDLGEGGNGGLNELSCDATPNFDTYTFQVSLWRKLFVFSPNGRCVEAIEVLPAFFFLIYCTWMIFARFIESFLTDILTALRWLTLCPFFALAWTSYLAVRSKRSF